MSIVNTLPESADDVRELTSRCTAISPDVEDYIVQQAYLVEVVEEQVTPEYIAKKAISLIVDELTELGIYLDGSYEEICSQIPLMELALNLREKFDKNNLIELLKNREDLQLIVQNSLENQEDVLVTIVTMFAEKMSLDDGWNYIANRTELLYDEPELIQHLDAIMKQLELYGDPSVTDKHPIENVSEILHILDQRLQLQDKIYYLVVGRGIMSEDMQKNRAAVEKLILRLGRTPYLEQLIEQKSVDIPKSLSEKTPYAWDYYKTHESPWFAAGVGLVVMTWVPGDTLETLKGKVQDHIVGWRGENQANILTIVEKAIEASALLEDKQS